MHDARDPYQLLGVRRAATPTEIKAAHRRLAKRYHPDAPDGDTELFLAVQQAFELLADPLRRREWDARHSPGPVRAGDPGQGVRGGRAGAGRGASPPGGAASRATSPRAGRASGGRGTDGSRPNAGSATDGGRSRDGRDGDRTAGRPPADAGDPAARARGNGRTNGAETGFAPGMSSGRDPASRSYTWSASGVPWWEDEAAREARRPPGTKRPATAPPGAGTTGARAGRSSPGAPPTGPASRASDPTGPASRASDAARATGQAGRASESDRRTGTSGAAPSGASENARSTWSRTEPATEAGTWGSGGERSERTGTSERTAGIGGDVPPGPPETDVYARSSGAAWSAAARAYFRRGEADLPRGGVRVGEPRWGLGANPRAGRRPPATGARPEDTPRAARAGRTAGQPGARPAAQARDASAPWASGSSAAGADARRDRAAPRDAGASRDVGASRDAGARGEARRRPGLAATELGTVRATWSGARPRRAPWPTITERVLYATLAWLPVAIGIAYAGGAITGCDRASAGCPPLVEPTQTVLIAVTLAVLLALPRLAYYGAAGTLGVVAAAVGVVVLYTAIQVPRPVPPPFVALAVVSWISTYLLVAYVSTRDDPVVRPWLRYRGGRGGG